MTENQTPFDVVRELREHPIKSAWGVRVANVAADEIERLREWNANQVRLLELAGQKLGRIATIVGNDCDCWDDDDDAVCSFCRIRGVIPHRDEAGR